MSKKKSVKSIINSPKFLRVSVIVAMIAILLGGVVTPLILCWASNKWGWFK